MLTEKEWLEIGYSKGLIDPAIGTAVTLEDVYNAWIMLKETPTNKDNIKRLKSCWKAYYSGEPASKPIIESALSNLTPAMLREWAEYLLKKHHPVDKKKFSRMFGIVSQCFEYACDEDIHYLLNNPWEKAKKKINPILITGKPLPLDEEQVFTDEERREIYDMVMYDLERFKENHTSAGLQILFLFETGLRMGEVCGLKWSDVRGTHLQIRRQANNDGIKEWTKTDSGYREIPLTAKARELLDKVAEYNHKYGYDKEWIFQSDNAKYDYRLSYHSANRKLKKLCARLNTVSKSPHKCRKTCISALLDCPDLNKRTVQRFAGHSDISTTFQYYSFERKTKEEQEKLIEIALKI